MPPETGLCYTDLFYYPPESWLSATRTATDPAPRESIVKEGIHPQYQEVTVHCACGATWTTQSTRKDLHLEICSHCHPFFTGRQKLIDTEGRVERFTKKFGVQTAEQRKTAAKAAKETKAKTAKKTAKV
jgi:large subunit ribosomal protein L31